MGCGGVYRRLLERPHNICHPGRMPGPEPGGDPGSDESAIGPRSAPRFRGASGGDDKFEYVLDVGRSKNRSTHAFPSRNSQPFLPPHLPRTCAARSGANQTTGRLVGPGSAAGKEAWYRTESGWSPLFPPDLFRGLACSGILMRTFVSTVLDLLIVSNAVPVKSSRLRCLKRSKRSGSL